MSTTTFLFFRQNKRKRFVLSDKLHPQTISCVQTRALPFGIEISVENVFETDFSGKDISGVLFQYPDTEGSIMDFSNLTQEARKFGVSELQCCPDGLISGISVNSISWKVGTLLRLRFGAVKKCPKFM